MHCYYGQADGAFLSIHLLERLCALLDVYDPIEGSTAPWRRDPPYRRWIQRMWPPAEIYLPTFIMNAVHLGHTLWSDLENA